MDDNIGEMFSYISRTYDLLNHILSFNIDKLWRNSAIKHIKGQKILDVATGTADVTLAINRKRPESEIIGVDISLGMLDIAKHKTKEKGNIHLLCADAQHLPFSDNSFDSIIISFGIRNVKNRLQALYEFKRILIPNGILLILEFSRPENPLINAFYTIYKDYVLPEIGNLVSNNKNAYKYLSKTIRYFPDKDFLTNAILKVGFKKVSVKNLSFGIALLHIAYKEA